MSQSSQGLVIDLSRGSTHDGPGLRTTVFLKGCPLRCRWCQNPESIERSNELLWSKDVCIACGLCIKACPIDALEKSANGLVIHRRRCTVCGACVRACPTEAIVFAARWQTVDAILEDVEKDRAYYASSGGGVTLSGGEPLLQAAFASNLLQRLKRRGLHTALDTCGFAPQAALEEVLPFTDMVLFDLKLLNSADHQRWTGVPTEAIVNNFVFLVEHIRRLRGSKSMMLWVRTPLVPGYTATVDNIMEIGRFLQENAGNAVSRWELCAFNCACGVKYEKIGRPFPYAGCGPMDKAIIAELQRTAEVTFFSTVLVTGMVTGD